MGSHNLKRELRCRRTFWHELTTWMRGQSHLKSFSIKQTMNQTIGSSSQTHILDSGFHMNQRLAPVSRIREFTPDKGPKRSYTHRLGLDEPGVAVDSSSLIKPPLFKSGIGTYTDQVLATIIQILGYIINLCGIPTRLTTQIEAVNPDP